MRQAVLGVTALVLLSSCGGGGPADPAAPVVTVEGIKVTPQSVQLTAIGETRQLVASIAPANATDRAVTWESTDPSIVSVNGSGLVTARSAGLGVFVTAFSHDGHFQASANVGVAP